MDRVTIKQKLAEILENTVGQMACPVEEAARLQEDLSLDSVAVVAMMVEVQCDFQIELRAADLMKLVLVKDLIDLIQSKIAAKQALAA